MSEKKIILFGNKSAGIYRLSDIFDPDVHGADPQAAGKIVPALYSQVVDDINGRKNKLLTVINVHPVTFKSTLIYSSVPYSDDSRLITYTNNIHKLYYIGSEGKLIIDNRLAFFGDTAVKFQLVKENQDGTETVLSKYDEPLSSNPSVVDTIDLVVSSVNEYRTFGYCYTDLSVEVGTNVELKIYDANDEVVAQVTLLVIEAYGILESLHNPVIGLRVEANQMVNEDIVLYSGETTDILNFNYYLQYADGSESLVSNSESTCHVYGLTEVESSAVGANFTILFKAYLPSQDYNVNYVSEIMNLTILDSPANRISKISLIPIFNKVTRKWEFKQLTYFADRTTMPDMDDVNASAKFDTMSEVVISQSYENPFSNSTMYRQTVFYRLNSFKEFKFNNLTFMLQGNYTGNHRTWVDSDNEYIIRVAQTINRWELANISTGTVVNYSATFSGDSNPWDMDLIWYNSNGSVNSTIDIMNYIDNSNTSVNWEIASRNFITSGDVVIYGKNNYPYIRPKIYYGSLGVTTDTYYISANRYTESLFLNNFYFNALPPLRDLETVPPTPTHFHIKSTNNVVLTSSKVSIEDSLFNALPITGTPVSAGDIVIVEFYQRVDSIDYILYGVPVEIINRNE